MKKGKFGLVLCFYPIAAFVAAILNSPLIAVVLAAAAIFIERDEWAGRQTLQAWMLSVIMAFFTNICGLGRSVPIHFLAAALLVTSTVLYVIVSLCVIVLSVLGIIRTIKDKEANIPVLADIAYRIYGQRRPKSAVNQMPPAGFQPPYVYPQQGEQAPFPQEQAPQYPQYPQPFQQNQAPQAPFAPPQYIPPVNVPPQPIDNQPGPGSQSGGQ